MTNRLKISIALASYNGEKYIGDQIASFLNQTRLPDEIVICDDASSDTTVSVVRKIIRTSRVEIKLAENDSRLGYVQNFGKALSLCTGDIILLSDQDDVWFSHKIETIEKQFENSDSILAITNDQEITDKYLLPSGFTKMSNVKSAGLSPLSMVTGCCTSIRKELRDMVLPIPLESKSHDGWINGFADALQARVMLPDVLQYYRRHENNASHGLMSMAENQSRFNRLRKRKLRSAQSSLSSQLEISSIMRIKIESTIGVLRLNGFDDGLVDLAIERLRRDEFSLAERSKIVRNGRLRRSRAFFGFGGKVDIRIRKVTRAR